MESAIAIVLVLVVIVFIQATKEAAISRVHRNSQIGELWAARGVLMGGMEAEHLTHFESVQLLDRIRDIDAALVELGVPAEMLK